MPRGYSASALGCARPTTPGRRPVFPKSAANLVLPLWCVPKPGLHVYAYCDCDGRRFGRFLRVYKPGDAYRKDKEYRVNLRIEVPLLGSRDVVANQRASHRTPK